MTTQVKFGNSRVYFLASVAFCGVIAFGYDTGVAGGVIAQNAFIEHFLKDGGAADSNRVANVSGNVVSVLQAGAFFGSLGSAPISSSFGRRYSLICFAIIFSLGAVLQTIAGVRGRGLGYIYAGRFVAGVGVGGISAVSPTFVSECSPKDVRGRITGIFEITAVTGVMLSYFVNFGISQNKSIVGARVWQIPFGVQLIPMGTMTIGLFFVKESPRWLAYRGRTLEALESLTYLRKERIISQGVRDEMAEIEVAIEEERGSRKSLGIKEVFLGKGNLSRFVIAFFLMFFQQWTGQNSVNYFAPQMFQAIGYHGATQSLFASGIYGIIKVLTVVIFVFFFVERLGRKNYLAISSLGSGVLFFAIGAILKMHPPPTNPSVDSTPSAASKAMAALLYIFVFFYGIGWGPVPWIMSGEIFSTGTRHYGLAVASGSQWLWNFIVTRISPNLIDSLGWKIFMVYAAIDIGPMLFFSIALIPETRGKSLEEMDIIFGRVSRDERDTKVRSTQQALERDLQERQIKSNEDTDKKGSFSCEVRSPRV